MPTYSPDQIKRSQDLIAGSKNLLARAQTPVPQPQAAPPINRTVIEGNQYNPGPADPAESYLNTFRAPESPDQIAERKRQQSQGLIDSINKQFDEQVAERKQVGQQRVNMDNAISVLSGNAGGTEAVGSRRKVIDGNEKEVAAVNNQRALALAQVYTQISRDADQEARDQLTDATRSAEQIVARRQQSQQQAVENLKLMASSGQIDFDAFKSSPQNAKVYKYALDSAGGSEDALRGLFALNRPQDQVLDKRVVGSTMYITYENPITGKVRSEHFDLGFQVPTDWKTADLGDRVMFYDPADPDNHKYYSKGLTPDQAADKSQAAADTDQLYAGLSSPTATAVRARVNKFGSEPLVQNFATIQEGYNFASGIDANTKNPADDQALIYSLAKALDPGSVVREGEYATAQKYAQSWLNAYGKSVTQALAGTGFLSSAARENIKNTIESKFTASKKSYDNLYSNYETGINSLTGRPDGKQFLTDYATASDGGGLKSQVTAAGFDYDQMRADGYSDEQIQQALSQ